MDLNGFDMKKMRDVHYSGQGTNELHTIDTLRLKPQHHQHLTEKASHQIRAPR